MPSFSKNKERRHLAQIRPMFQKWWGEGSWNAVPASGALRWGDGSWTYCDLVPPTDFPFVIEAKFHKELKIDEILRLSWDRCRIGWFWYGCTVPAAIRATHDLQQTIYPMLVCRANEEPNRLVLQHDLVSRLPAATLKQLNYAWINYAGAEPFVVFDLKQFFTLVPRTLFESTILA